VNVLGDEGGMDSLRALGARSVPIVSRGDDFVYAQVIKDVVDFLDLGDDTKPELSATALAERYLGIIDKAIALVRQMPDQALERELPNRPRSWRVLMHHVFQIPCAFLNAEESGRPLSYEDLLAPPPEEMVTSNDIANFGETIRERFESWWRDNARAPFDVSVDTYFGETTRHELLERTVWHSTQHARQIASLIEQTGLEPVASIDAADVAGLPLTDKVWDENP
jgi:uncharacterized damage-inducible protein DinB